MKMTLLAPIIIPLITAIGCLFFWPWPRIQRALGIIGAAALFAASLAVLHTVWHDGIQAVQIGGWPAPFGITLVSDLFSALMVVLNGLTGLAVMGYSLASMDPEREANGYYPLFHILLMGVSGAFLTGDIFNLYVWFEVMLIASFVLMAMGGERAQMEGALKYVTLNLVSSALFLAALGILYGLAGSLNMADLALTFRSAGKPGLCTTLAMLFLVAFGIKAAVFPLFFWLPASYHTPPPAVSALFAGLLTKVGVYALVRVFTLLFVHDPDFTHSIVLMAVAGLTMVTGVLGAVAQNEMRRILSFHIVSQIGYMVMGLALFTPLSIAGTVFYIGHHIIVKTNLFLVSGLVHRLQGSYELAALGGVYAARPWLAILFMVPALSLAGIPPLSGFFAKFILVLAGLQSGHYLIVVAALAVSILTLFSMIKIWNEVFWKEDPSPAPDPVAACRDETAPAGAGPWLWGFVLPIVLLAVITVTIGMGAEGMFRLSMRAAEQLMNPDGYIQSVLGG